MRQQLSTIKLRFGILLASKVPSKPRRNLNEEFQYPHFLARQAIFPSFSSEILHTSLASQAQRHFNTLSNIFYWFFSPHFKMLQKICCVKVSSVKFSEGKFVEFLMKFSWHILNCLFCSRSVFCAFVILMSLFGEFKLRQARVFSIVS
jgi:hypothetical protein